MHKEGQELHNELHIGTVNESAGNSSSMSNTREKKGKISSGRCGKTSRKTRGSNSINCNGSCSSRRLPTALGTTAALAGKVSRKMVSQLGTVAVASTASVVAISKQHLATTATPLATAAVTASNLRSSTNNYLCAHCAYAACSLSFRAC